VSTADVTANSPLVRLSACASARYPQILTGVKLSRCRTRLTVTRGAQVPPGSRLARVHRVRALVVQEKAEETDDCEKDFELAWTKESATGCLKLMANRETDQRP